MESPYIRPCFTEYKFNLASWDYGLLLLCVPLSWDENSEIMHLLMVKCFPESLLLSITSLTAEGYPRAK